MMKQKVKVGSKLLIGVSMFDVVVTTAQHCGVTDEASETVLMYTWERITEIAKPVVEIVYNEKYKTPEVKVVPVSFGASPGFAVGDKVRSIYGMFEGVVVALEPQYSRVICVSDRVSGYDERQRWAYKPDELRKKLTSVIEFEYGRKYKIHSRHKGVKSVDVIGTTGRLEDEVKLIDLNSGATFGTFNKRTSKNALVLAGIAKVDLLD